ncbi:hypothetical protein AB0M22_37850 [Nocardia sp. NPDC051756]|uniref:hypothetical protein n=1 Tax=Nocardia sp. NPDC051756 TaxID=3154751 RepID=UPI0034367D6A
MVTRPATNLDGLLPTADESSADVARLLRAFGRRALFLAALALLIGLHLLALVLALAGIGLLVVPVSGGDIEPPAERR